MSQSNMSPREVLALCRQREIQAIDLRFTDFCGSMRHFTIPVRQLTEESFEHGFSFDGSSMPGWQAIHESDMQVVPESQTCFVDPFMKSTLALLCNVRDPVTHQTYARDPRNIARKAEAWLQSTGIADRVLLAVESEFFVFDSVRFDQCEQHGFYYLDGEEGQWNRGQSVRGGGSAIRHREGYLALSPQDGFQDLRTEIMMQLEESGIRTERQHHEVASGGQCEIALQADSLVRMCDSTQRLKYIVRNTAQRHGRTATFMPKPIWNDNGSGMHLGLSLFQGDQCLFSGSGYGGLSETAMYAIGSTLLHCWPSAAPPPTATAVSRRASMRPSTCPTATAIVQLPSEFLPIPDRNLDVPWNSAARMVPATPTSVHQPS